MTHTDRSALYRETRENAGLDRKGVSDITGTPAQHVWAYESGAKQPGLKVLEALAEAIGKRVKISIE